MELVIGFHLSGLSYLIMLLKRIPLICHFCPKSLSIFLSQQYYCPGSVLLSEYFSSFAAVFMFKMNCTYLKHSFTMLIVKWHCIFSWTQQIRTFALHIIVNPSWWVIKIPYTWLWWHFIVSAYFLLNNLKSLMLLNIFYLINL